MQRFATLLLFAAAGTFPSPVAADDFEDEPLEEFCLTQDGGPQTCLAFFLDEDGYELCLMDEKDRIARCMRSWRLEPDRKPGSGSLLFEPDDPSLNHRLPGGGSPTHRCRRFIGWK
jgi:hypothetical protein